MHPPNHRQDFIFAKRVLVKQEISHPPGGEFLNNFLSSRWEYTDISKNILNENRHPKLKIFHKKNN